MIERYVLDCSVAAKWYLQDEEQADRAQLIQGRFIEGKIELHAPELLKYELGNALSRAQRASRPRISRAEGEHAFAHFLKLGIVFHELDAAALGAAFHFANRFHRNFYDSSYLWLADHLDCSWLTAEQRFLGPHPLGFPQHRIQVLGSPGDTA